MNVYYQEEENRFMQVEIGAIYDGKVSGLTNFGAFVVLEDGKTTGMVHISEVSNGFVKDIKDVLTENQEVKVKVISVNDDGKISLSIKQALPQEERRERKPRPKFNRNSDNVWQGNKNETSNESMSFEDMMARFKQVSDEKMTDLKRSKESKHGAGFSRGRAPRN